MEGPDLFGCELAIAAKQALFERFASERSFEKRVCPPLAPSESEVSLAYLTGLENLSVQLMVVTQLVPRAAVWNEAHAYAAFVQLIEAHPVLFSPKLMALSSLFAGMAYDPTATAPYQAIIRRLAGDALR